MDSHVIKIKKNEQICRKLIISNIISEKKSSLICPDFSDRNFDFTLI